MKGDILLYKGDGRSILHRLIQWRTHGPYVHVEVDMGDGSAIGAHLQDGVQRRPINPDRDIATVHLDVPDDRLEAGLAFLQKTVGDSYSLTDIINQALTYFLPKAILVQQQTAYDCSDLVSRYLEITGGLSLPPSLLATPSLISPNDIARAAHLL